MKNEERESEWERVSKCSIGVTNVSFHPFKIKGWML